MLRRWVGHATSFFEQEDKGKQRFTFEPPAVRTLLAEHARLLVVLDNVWSLAAPRPLLDALPPAAHLLITTRDEEIGRGPVSYTHLDVYKRQDLHNSPRPRPAPASRPAAPSAPRAQSRQRPPVSRSVVDLSLIHI